jgi:hypothetical protein
VEHLEGDGARFFELVCEQDLEESSQAIGRGEMFDRLLSER